MFPLGSEGGFHFRMIWDEELETDIGSNGTEGTVREEAEVTALPCQSLAKQGPAQVPFLWESSIPWHPAGSSRLGWMILEVSS